MVVHRRMVVSRMHRDLHNALQVEEVHAERWGVDHSSEAAGYLGSDCTTDWVEEVG